MTNEEYDALPEGDKYRHRIVKDLYENTREQILALAIDQEDVFTLTEEFARVLTEESRKAREYMQSGIDGACDTCDDPDCPRNNPAVANVEDELRKVFGDDVSASEINLRDLFRDPLSDIPSDNLN